MNLDNDYDNDGNNIVPCPICLDVCCPRKEGGKCPEEDEYVKAMSAPKESGWREGMSAIEQDMRNKIVSLFATFNLEEGLIERESRLLEAVLDISTSYGTESAATAIAATEARVVDVLIAEGYLKGKELLPHYEGKNTHGTCCNCSTCRHQHDDCVCEHNRLLAALFSSKNL